MIKSSLYAISMTAAMLLTACASVQSQTTKVCYVPFNVDTFNATTPASIFEEDCRQIKNDDPIIDNLHKYIADRSNVDVHQPVFDSEVVRLGILEGDKPIYIDQNGVVLAGRRMYQLPKATFVAVAKILDDYFK